MMTREEAIQHLRVDWFQARSGQICVNPDRKDQFLEAIDMAIIALALQEVNAPYEKNHPGCPICRNHEVLAWDMCNDGIVIESDGRIHMLCGGDWETLIRYCPNCGRPLSKETLAELERKVEKYEKIDN